MKDHNYDKAVRELVDQVFEKTYGPVWDAAIQAVKDNTPEHDPGSFSYYFHIVRMIQNARGEHKELHFVNERYAYERDMDKKIVKMLVDL